MKLKKCTTNKKSWNESITSERRRSARRISKKMMMRTQEISMDRPREREDLICWVVLAARRKEVHREEQEEKER